jgi:exonuclease SbcC
MQLRSLSLRGVTTFTHRADVDFAALGAGLVAIVGRNGAGKTSLMDAVAASLYRTFPTRPNLYDYCSGKDAFIETSWRDDAGEIKVRLAIDAELRKTEGYLFRNGVSLTSGRAREFEEEVRKLFGPYDLFLASVFAAQDRSGDFLRMAKAERKALFVELLRLKHLEELQMVANAQRAQVERELAGLRGLLAAADDEISLLPAEEDILAAAVNGAESAAGRLETARTEEAAAIVAVERARTAEGRIASLRSAKVSAGQSYQAAVSAVDTAKRAEQDAQTNAARRRASIRSGNPDAQEARAKARHASLIQDLEGRQRKAERAQAERAECETAAREIGTLEQEREQLQQAIRTRDQAARDKVAAEAAETAADRRMQDAERHAIEEEERLARDSKLIGQVPCSVEHAWPDGTGRARKYPELVDACPLLKVARDSAARLESVKGGKSIPAELREAVSQTRLRANAATEALETAEMTCDPHRLAEILTKLPGLRATAERLPAAVQAARDLATISDDRSRANADLRVEIDAAATERKRIESELADVERELVAATAKAGAEYSAATARERAALQAREAADEAYEKAFREADAHPVPVAEANLSKARTDRHEAEQRLRTAEAARERAAAKVEALQARQRSAEETRANLAVAESELGDWSLLEKALGRDGIQALEIDAAGPEVAKLTNELLEACYGSRFSIAFETLREKKSARGEYSEAFDVRVFDEGRERQVEGLSGGEKVVVGEAIGLALSIFNARRSGVRHETLFRDETAGALDPKNAAAYVDLLRKARVMGGFHQVVFIAHQPEVWERADARLLVEAGAVRVDGAAPRAAESRLAAAV